MPNGYRVRQVNRFENVGSPAVRTSNHSNAQAKGPCMRSAAAVRSAEELLPRMVKQFGRLRGRQMCAKIALSQNGTAVIRG